MSNDLFKEPPTKHLYQKRSIEHWPPVTRKRTRERFLSFCNIVLAYTRYESSKQQELRLGQNTSPTDNSGSSAAESCSSESAGTPCPDKFPLRHPSRPRDRHADPTQHQDVPSDDDSYELITCYCLKPFAGRPMIECSCCLTWVHLSCAKIRRTNIPEDFSCQLCKDRALNKRTSGRGRCEQAAAESA